MLTIFLSHDKKSQTVLVRLTHKYFWNTPGSLMLVIKGSWCNAQVSIITACKNMHDCIIDKTCIDRIIENSTNCFHKEPFVESPVCEMPSSKRISI